MNAVLKFKPADTPAPANDDQRMHDAAPELLGALKEMLAWYTLRCMADRAPAIRARNAIAKAEGK